MYCLCFLWKICWRRGRLPTPLFLGFPCGSVVKNLPAMPHDPDNQDGVITHLLPDILESKVKWALGSITTNKASGGDGIPAELFQILKDGIVKVLHSICQQIWKNWQWPQDWKRLVFISIPKKDNAKECSNYRAIVLISHASKVKTEGGRRQRGLLQHQGRIWSQPLMLRGLSLGTLNKGALSLTFISALLGRWHLESTIWMSAERGRWASWK